MILLGKERNNGGMIKLIREKMKSGSHSSYDKLKEENANMTHSKYKEGAEQDQKGAMDECISQTMQALESKDADKFKSCMRNMVKMIMSENEDSESES